MTVAVRPCQSVADVAAVEETLPTGRSAFHRERYERRDRSTYLLAWADSGIATGPAPGRHTNRGA